LGTSAILADQPGYQAYTAMQRISDTHLTILDFGFMVARRRAAIDFSSKHRPRTLLGQPLLSDAVKVGPQKLASRTPPRPPLRIKHGARHQAAPLDSNSTQALVRKLKILFSINGPAPDQMMGEFLS